ncbi:MAG: Fic family protein [Chloroflexi bacterium]|nr:Fic family protein [Chloroflexota bacterium]
MELEIAVPSDVAADISDAEQAVARLNAQGPTLASLEALSRLLLRAEAVASSRIEGLEVAGRRLMRLEAARAIGSPFTDVTAEAVLGNIEAMALAVGEVSDRPRLALDDLLSIHRSLMRHTERPDWGGVVRTAQNWVGGNDFNPCGAAFVPPPPAFVPALLDDLVAFMNADRYPPLVQAALVHAQFETIHPFADGNGRVGRALIHVVLRRRGLAPRYVPPISPILATEVRSYIGGLNAYRYLGPSDAPAAQAGILDWIRIFVSMAARAARDAERFGQRVDDLAAEWRTRAQPVRASSAVDLLIHALPSAPVVTVQTAANLIGRSLQATNQAVDHLVRAGVLAPVRDVRRNRAFEATGLLDLLTSFERSLASPAANTRASPPARPVPRRPSP